MSETIPLPPPSFGFQNPINICFMNSVLQCLLRAPKMWDFLLSLQVSEDNREHIVLGLRLLAHATKTHKVLNPVFMLKIVGHERFRPGYQHDAHEFLNTLLDLLHESPTSKKFIEDNFQGTTTLSTRCTHCNKKSYREENFFSIQVPITSDNLVGCLRSFQFDETLDDDNLFHCEGCNKKTNAVRQLRITSIKQYFVIALKRFDNFGNKVHTKVEIPDFLKFHGIAYKLFAVCTHVGDLHRGHYFADVLDRDTSWVSFNDEHFFPKPPITEFDNAYILFYEREISSC